MFFPRKGLSGECFLLCTAKGVTAYIKTPYLLIRLQKPLSKRLLQLYYTTCRLSWQYKKR